MGRPQIIHFIFDFPWNKRSIGVAKWLWKPPYDWFCAKESLGVTGVTPPTPGISFFFLDEKRRWGVLRRSLWGLKSWRCSSPVGDWTSSGVMKFSLSIHNWSSHYRILLVLSRSPFAHFGFYPNCFYVSVCLNAGIMDGKCSKKLLGVGI